jgi:hypothetical protein
MKETPAHEPPLERQRTGSEIALGNAVASLFGIGREGGIHSLNFYSQPSNICIKF